jgi:hypothetical protein
MPARRPALKRPRRSPGSAPYASPGEGIRAVRDEFLYWSARVTETSFHLSLAVIAANWAVFGSLQRILANPWSKLSLALVIIGLASSLAGAKWMSELHLHRFDYASSDPGRWNREARDALGRRDPWPFTPAIERLGRILRESKTWLPLLAGLAFLLALFAR